MVVALTWEVAQWVLRMGTVWCPGWEREQLSWTVWLRAHHEGLMGSVLRGGAGQEKGPGNRKKGEACPGMGEIYQGTDAKWILLTR